MKFNSSGQVAKLLLVLAAIVLVAIVITYLVVQTASKPKAPVKPGEVTVPLPIYEQKLGNIKFIFMSASNKGNILKASDVTNTVYGSQKDLGTTENFIMVTVGAQNVGNSNTEQGAWDIGNIIDAKGKIFIPEDNYLVNPWLPLKNNCGVLLKPAFDPSPCTKVYEVAKSSGLTGLKIQVQTGLNDNNANDFSAGRRLTQLIDLIVK